MTDALRPSADETASDNERILHHVRRLSRKSPIRQIAERVLAGNPISDADGLACITRLNMHSATHWRERLVAAWVLGHLPADELTRVAPDVPLVQQVVANPSYRAIRRSCAAGSKILSALYVGGSIVAAGYSVATGGPDELGLVFLAGLLVVMAAGWAFVGPAISPIVGPISVMLDNHVRAEGVRSLEALSAFGAIPAIAGAAADHSPELRRAGRTSLSAMLRAVPHDAYGALCGPATPKLSSLLKNADPAFAIDLLTGLEKIGDGRAVPAVERCARMGATQEVRERAAEVLPILQKRLQDAKDAAHLLRPAAAPGADTLLRPASAGESTAPELLLRPACGPEEDVAAENRTV